MSIKQACFLLYNMKEKDNHAEIKAYLLLHLTNSITHGYDYL